MMCKTMSGNEVEWVCLTVRIKWGHPAQIDRWHHWVLSNRPLLKLLVPCAHPFHTNLAWAQTRIGFQLRTPVGLEDGEAEVEAEGDAEAVQSGSVCRRNGRRGRVKGQRGGGVVKLGTPIS